MSNIPKESQINAILSVTEWKLAKEFGLSGVDEIKWTVSKKEVIEYVEKHGFPRGWVWLSEETYDGVYLLEEKGKWIVRYQERGISHYEHESNTRDEALEYLLDEYYLKRKRIA